MTGPPTPPPTSATEMADEARNLPPPPPPPPAPVEASPAPAPPVAASPSQPKQAPQDSYQLLFPTLSNLAYQDDYKQIVAVAERGDLKVYYFSVPIMRYMLF
jgi:COP9 signalosome complex subunit 8